jgi:Cof subfamily protein (haloacid dehalogenase superfamily)
VSPRTRTALEQAREAGITVVLVSARSPRSVRLVARDVGVDGFAVCANGATVYDLDEERIVDHHPLPSQIATVLVQGVRDAAPGVTFACERELEFSCEPLYEVHDPYPPRDFEYARGDALELVAASPVTKLIVRHPDLPLERLASVVATVAGSDAAVTVSGKWFVEVSAAGVTKALALDALAARLGIRADEAVAFGDMPNDLPMLAWAGRAVAVANAHPEVLAVADEVTASNDDDGVALVLERLVSVAVGGRPP